MSCFKVDIRQITDIWKHPNADALEIVKVNDLAYQMITKLGDFKVGDPCVYFPIDSVIPNSVLEKIGLEGKLSGSEKNRVKSIKLRQVISQGLVARLDTLGVSGSVGDDITDVLEVTKYEPKEVFFDGYKMGELPNGLTTYDIENAERYPIVYNALVSERCYVTEKLEGTNVSVVVDENDVVWVNSRRKTVEHGNNIYWNTVTAEDLIDKLKLIKKNEDLKHVVIYGELIGPSVQKNIYKLDKNLIYAFDLKFDHVFIEPLSFKSACNAYDIRRVPEINTLDSNGPSVLNSKILREGIVIKPFIEQYDYEIGRVMLKIRDAEYLCAQSS